MTAAASRSHRPRRFDYVVVGAGAAGCVLAARLSEDPSASVLLVEAGGSDRSLIIAMPAAVPLAYQSRRLGWGYEAGPEPHLGGRVIDEKRGKVVGGSTSINAMTFNRGNPLDFDGWAAAGLPDWDYAHCLPYFQRMETFAGGADRWRGGGGPMRIGRSRAAHKFYDAFLRAGEQAGHAHTPDHNGYRQEGVHVAQTFVHDGLRWSAARGYLRPARARPNLRVLTDALVTGIVVEGGAALGIGLVRRGRRETVLCEREVVLCAGTFNSPKLLMLSGIGDGDELRRHGIATKAHLPGVGRNLENHPGVNVQYASPYEDSLARQLNALGRVRMAAQWAVSRGGLGATSFWETGAFLRSRDDVPFPDIQFEFLPLSRVVRDGRIVAIPGFQVWLDLMRPASNGRVALRSTDPAAAPSIVFNHLAAREDLRDLVAGIRLARDLARQQAWDRYRGEELAPGPGAASDEALAAYVRATAGTTYHPAGTCRMGAGEDAVVDGEGRVRGVERLRVADASIMPRIVSGNLTAATIMLAEKIADRIRGLPPLPPSDAPFHRADAGA